jgi:hypothetical protein
VPLTKPLESVTASEWLAALDTKGTLDLITQFDLCQTTAVIQIEVDKITPPFTRF